VQSSLTTTTCGTIEPILTSVVEWESQQAEPIEKGDVLIIGAGDEEKVATILGRLRLLVAARNNLIASMSSNMPLVSTSATTATKSAVHSNTWNFLWVVDFPLFTRNPETGLYS